MRTVDRQRLHQVLDPVRAAARTVAREHIELRFIDREPDLDRVLASAHTTRGREIAERFAGERLKVRRY